MSPSRSPSIRRLVALPATLALLASSLVPSVTAADALSVTTPYPGIVAAPGSNVSFTIDVETAEAARVDLAVSGVPSGWTATLRGGGFVVDSVLTKAGEPTTVRLDVNIPTAATDGSNRVVVTARSGDTSVVLPLDIRVDVESAGEVTLETDFPGLRGSSDTTFNFNLTLRNGTAEDVTYAVNAIGPSGWEVSARLTGQAQAASAIAQAGGTSGISISVSPPAGVAAGLYPIDVQATAGARQIPLQLAVEITGTYSLSLSTPDARLNGRGTAGAATEQQLTLINTGTADLVDVALTASSPSGWTATFDQETVASIPADSEVTVTVSIVPSGDAVAGDYALTIRASNAQANDSIDFRFTVETSPLWFIVGIALIVAVGAGLWWVFQRYGRR